MKTTSKIKTTTKIKTTSKMKIKSRPLKSHSWSILSKVALVWSNFWKKIIKGYFTHSILTKTYDKWKQSHVFSDAFCLLIFFRKFVHIYSNQPIIDFWHFQVLQLYNFYNYAHYVVGLTFKFHSSLLYI